MSDYERDSRYEDDNEVLALPARPRVTMPAKLAGPTLDVACPECAEVSPVVHCCPGCAHVWTVRKSDIAPYRLGILWGCGVDGHQHETEIAARLCIAERQLAAREGGG